MTGDSAHRLFDVVLYLKGSCELIEHRCQRDDLREISNWWQERMRRSVEELPSEWIERALSRLTVPKPWEPQSHPPHYRYDSPVHLDPQVLRLRPREDGTQRLVRYELRIEPTPAGISQGLDQDGNVVLNAWLDRPASVLEVYNRFEQDTLRENPFDFVLAPPSLTVLPMVYPEILHSTLRPVQGSGSFHCARARRRCASPRACLAGQRRLSRRRRLAHGDRAEDADRRLKSGARTVTKR